MPPTIAVVIPAYNSASTISSAILSALKQSSPPDEVIVVDDGSTDSTVEVVCKFGTSIKLISQTNQGSAVARQTGTNAATSEYIAYLDADDWWPDDKLSICRSILAHEHIDFMLADLQRARPGDPPEAYLKRNSTFFPRAWKYLHGHEITMDIPNIYKMPPEIGLSLLLDGFPVFPSTILVRRDVIQAVGGWDARFRRCQDFDLGLRIARRYPLHYFHHVQAILGLHDVNIDGHPYLIKQLEGDIRVLKVHYNAEPQNSQYRKRLARTLALKSYGLGNAYRNIGDTKKARQTYLHALRWPGKRLNVLYNFILLLRPL